MEPLTGKDVAFFGKLTAGMTHEVKNILAIIKESSGLMEDLVAISPLSDARYQEKFNKSLNTINKQLLRGMELSAVFNRFAHSPDKIFAEINLNEVVNQVIILAQRFARLKYITLAPIGNQADQSLTIVNNSVWVQLALFTSVECCLAVLPANSTITLTPEKFQDKPAVTITCKDGMPDNNAFNAVLSESDCWSELVEIMAALKGEVKEETSLNGFRLIFG